VRILLGEIVAAETQPTIVDIEAGLEHLSRGTARNIDTLLTVLERCARRMTRRHCGICRATLPQSFSVN
jgi:CO dehydrogenase nickel-insertion accessory protein CooC1